MKTTDIIQLKLKVHQIALALVLIGAVNWGTTAFGYNLVEMLHTNLNSLLGMETYSDKIIYVIVTLAALKLMFRMDTWLPFLGYSALPSTFIPLKSMNGDTSITVKVRPNTKVAYWSSSKVNKEGVPDVKEAYNDYSNSGVVMSDASGNAKLIFNKGTSYIVPWGKEIARHVHYREVGFEWGMLGPVKTEYY
jgi:uncharacterized membrane protein YuzA (DUF378 family)